MIDNRLTGKWKEDGFVRIKRYREVKFLKINLTDDCPTVTFSALRDDWRTSNKQEIFWAEYPLNEKPKDENTCTILEAIREAICNDEHCELLVYTIRFKRRVVNATNEKIVKGCRTNIRA